jgi:hypothetical protein
LAHIQLIAPEDRDSSSRRDRLNHSHFSGYSGYH